MKVFLPNEMLVMSVFLFINLLGDPHGESGSVGFNRVPLPGGVPSTPFLLADPLCPCSLSSLDKEYFHYSCCARPPLAEFT